MKYFNNGIPEFISQLWFFPGKRTPGMAAKGAKASEKKKQRAGFLEEEEALAAEQAAESSDDDGTPRKRSKK